jgi:flagellar hook-basal body complex protein FliE
MSSVGLPLNSIEIPGLKTHEPRVDKPASSPDEFTQSLKSAVEKLDASQVEGDTEAAKLAGGAGNLHETMLALEKADVTMRVAVKARNKMIDAYNEVMRMSV